MIQHIRTISTQFILLYIIVILYWDSFPCQNQFRVATECPGRRKLKQKKPKVLSGQADTQHIRIWNPWRDTRLYVQAQHYPHTEIMDGWEPLTKRSSLI